MVQKKIPLINAAHGSDTRNIINEIIKAINDRGLEILSESSFLNWLNENGVKHLGEWDDTKEYDRFSVVLHEGASYTSKKRVPVGIDIENEEYWVLTGNYNAQVEYYREDVERVSSKLNSKADLEYVDGELNKKLSGTINLSEYNIISDSITDQTPKMVALFEEGGPLHGGRGTITIPYGTKFNVDDFYNNVPAGYFFKDESSINYNHGQQGTYHSKVYVFRGSDLEDDDSSVVVQSGHHALFSLNNFGAAGSESAEHGKNTISFANGKLGNYPKTSAFLQHSKHPLRDEWSLSYIRQRMFGNDEYDPTVLFQVDQYGKLAIGGATTNSGNLSIQNKTDSTNTLFSMSNTKNNSSIFDTKTAKDGNGNNTVLRHEYYGENSEYVLKVDDDELYTNNPKLRKHKNAKGIDWKRITESTSSPNVEYGEYFIYSGGGTITGFTTPEDDIEITLLFSGDTSPTLRNSNVFRLKGSVDWSPSKNSTITMYKCAAVGSGWFEKTRTEM